MIRNYLISFLFYLSLTLLFSPLGLALNDLWTENLGQSGISIMRPGSCAQLQVELQNFESWKESLASPEEPALETITEFSSQASESGQIQCRVIGKNILPPNLENLLKKTPAKNGPNCWNTALFSHNILRSIRFTSAEEFGFWLNSPYCRPLQKNEDPQSGDIIAIRTYGYDPDLNRYTDEISEVHGFTNVSALLSFSKDTSRKEDPFDLATKEDVFARFRLDSKQCQQIIGQNSQCSIWANYYRCQKMNEERILQSITDVFGQDFSAQLISIEKQIEDDNLGIKPLNKTELEKVSTVIEDLKKQLRKTQEKPIDKNAFIQKSVLLEIESLLVGLEYGQK